MAYVSNNLSVMSEYPMTNQVKEWLYITTDSLATVLGSAYFSDAGKKGMALGDIVHVVNQVAPTYNLLQIGAVSGTGYAKTATATVPAGVEGPQLANFRNLLDGGDFTTNPWQRGTSFTVSSSTSVTYTADRWFVKCSNASGGLTVSRAATAAVLGTSQGLKIARTAANANTAVYNFGQILEGADCVRCRGQQLTVSFWAVAGANYSPTTPLTCQVISGTTADEGAASSISGYTGASTIINATFTPTTTAQLFTFTSSGTVPVGCNELALLFGVTPVGNAGSDDSVTILAVQLEIGSQATPFEHRDVQVELEICQRYFYQINEPASGVIVGTGSVSASNTELFYLALPVQMRAAPTVAVTVGTFKSNSSTAGVVAATGLTGNATHTVNAVGLTSTGTGTAGQAAMLQGGGGAGLITVSADL